MKIIDQNGEEITGKKLVNVVWLTSSLSQNKRPSLTSDWIFEHHGKHSSGQEVFLEKTLYTSIILADFEDIKPKLNKWYKIERTKLLVFYKSENHNFGFNHIGKWGILGSANKSEYIEPTEEEVKERLIEEAKRRGFEGSVKWYSLFDTSEVKGNTKYNSFEYSFTNRKEDFDVTLSLNGRFIFWNGNWAEPIKQPVFEYQFLIKNCLDQHHVTKEFYTKEEAKKQLTCSVVKKIKETKRIRKS